MIIVEPFPEPFNSTGSVTITLEVHNGGDSLVTGRLDSEFNRDWITYQLDSYNTYFKEISSKPIFHSTFLRESCPPRVR